MYVCKDAYIDSNEDFLRCLKVQLLFVFKIWQQPSSARPFFRACNFPGIST